MKKIICLFVCLFVFSGVSSATVYDWDVMNDGASTTLDVGSDDPIGVNLAAGDSFNYNVEADANDYWQVDVAGGFFPFLAFLTSDPGTRVADLTLTLLLDGVQQFIDVQSGVSQSSAHIGTSTINLAAGLQFDEIVLDYFLNSSTSLQNNITDFRWGIHGDSFFSGITYKQGQSTQGVPEPAALALLGIGLAGFGFSRKKKFKGSGSLI